MEVEHVSAAEFSAIEAALAAASRKSRPHIFDIFLLSGGYFGVSARPRWPIGVREKLEFSKGEQIYIGNRVVWKWRMLHYTKVSGILGELGRVNHLPEGIRRLGGLLANKVGNIKIEDIRKKVGEDFWEGLKDFQKDGVRMGIEMGGRLILGDEMGLGKTIQALGIVRYFRGKRPTLVLCPASLRQTWKEAVLRWNKGVRAREIRVVGSRKEGLALCRCLSHSGRDAWDSGPVVKYIICAYDMMSHISRDVEKIRIKSGALFNAVIADESHSLRNMSTERARFCVSLMMKIPYRILCTGTPILSRPRELYPLLYLVFNENSISHPVLGYEEYAERYCGGALASHNGISNLDELNTILKSVMIRRKKVEIIRSLPPIRRKHVVLKIEAQSLSKFTRTFDELQKLEEELENPSLDSAERAAIAGRRKGLYAILYMMTAKAKLPGIVTRVRQLLYEKEPKKLLVFANHMIVLDAVSQLMEREKIRYVRLDGETRAEKRSELVGSFQHETDVRVAVLSVHVAGAGLTLTKADVVFFAELSMVPGVLRQAEDRAHRLGRVGAVDVEYAVAPGTLDDRMWTMIRHKMGTIGVVVDGLGGYKEASKTLDPKVKDIVLTTSCSAVQDTIFSAEIFAAEGILTNSLVKNSDCITHSSEDLDRWIHSKRLRVA